jgi:16S rRNA (cytosine967-C5)-methyltransferase
MRMENRGRVLSFDLHENKLSLIRSGAVSLGIDIIEPASADARDFIPSLEGKADAVLCDVPCSGYGVIAKKPEIRFKPLSDAEKLPEIQYAILENCSQYVKSGGVLVYSTCTVLPEENEKNTKRFLDEHPEFEPCDITVCEKTYHGEVQLLPNIHGTDGFYISKFRKKVGR